jgi:hypothetical protein
MPSARTKAHTFGISFSAQNVRVRGTAAERRGLGVGLVERGVERVRRHRFINLASSRAYGEVRSAHAAIPRARRELVQKRCTVSVR